MHIREVAEVMGKNPPAMRYKENMSNHFMYGSNKRIKNHIKQYGNRA
jgi:betaine-homocysteine S-methyltransferase